MHRVAVVASHPIQYQAPWFRALAKVCDLTVYFCHRQDAAGQARAGFGTAFDWDVPLLDGYHHEWLDNRSARPSVDRFGGCDTPGIRELLAAGRFDACIVSGWYLRSYLQAIRACWANQIPVLIRGDSNLTTERHRVTSLAKHLPYRWFLQRVDGFLYVGEANRAYLRHFGVSPARLYFAPHFVDNDWFGTGAERARQSGEVSRLRQRWGGGPSTRFFLFVGKLIALKRAGDFVDAVARLSREGHDVLGVLVGSGPEETALHARSAAEGAPIVFEGFQNQGQLPARYAAADGLVLPSTRETWGLVVNEGMATGLPAIVSNAVGCAADLVEDGRTGFSYPAGDVDALTTRMRELASWRPDQVAEARLAVLDKISRYSTTAAVDGTLRALDAMGRRGRRNQRGASEARHA